ncbi:MAG: Ig-like domain-containing protein, partial [Nanoarchaeota archaeon]
DSAGNMREGDLQSFTVANRIPQVQNITINSDAAGNGTNVNLTGSFAYQDPESDALSFNETRWYNNSIEATNLKNLSSVNYVNTTRLHNWTYSARVYDGLNFSVWVNSSIHQIINTPPSFDTDISNSTFNEDSDQINVTDIDTYFSDPDSDPLTYSTSISGGVTAVIDSLGNLSYFPSPNWFGTATLNITASDGHSTNKSNIITLTVRDVAETLETLSNVLGKASKLVGIEIVVPSPVSMFINDKVVLPIIIKNDKQITLSNINLQVQSSSEQLITRFKTANIPSLAPGEQVTTDMEITSGPVITEDKYTILLTAITGQGASDSAEFFVNVADYGSGNRTVILPRLQVAKDLFKSNPQCLELSELLSQAEDALDEKQFTKSESLIENAIKGCNDLLSFVPEKIETPVRKSRQNLILFSELLSFMVLTAAFMLYRKRRTREIQF